MDDHPSSSSGAAGDTALVECLLLTVRDPRGLAGATQLLASLARRHVLRLLDVAYVVRSLDDAQVTTPELVDVVSPGLLAAMGERVGSLFSDRDVHNAALLVEPGTSALLLLVEDRWAAGLARACRVAGGRLVVGERVAPALLDAPRPDAEARRSRADNPDLLAVPPHADLPHQARWVNLIVDPADSLAEVTDLYQRGLISHEQLESQKDHIFGAARRHGP